MTPLELLYQRPGLPGFRIPNALAATYGNQPALIFEDQPLSFAELAADARRVASALAGLGVSKGTRIGLLMPNRPDFLRCAFGAWRLGAILVPINTLFRGPELVVHLRGVVAWLQSHRDQLCPHLASLS